MSKIMEEQSDDRSNAVQIELRSKQVAYVLDACSEFDADLTLSSLIQFPQSHMLRLLDEINDSYGADRNHIPVHHIMKFVQVLTENQTASSPQRIIVSEAEDAAISDAQTHIDRIKQEMHALGECATNTDKEYAITRDVVNNTFDTFVSALRSRQNLLLSELEKIKQYKLYSLRKQILSCKSCQHEHNDLLGKWEQMLSDDCVDRHTRRKQMVKDFGLLMDKVKALRAENTKIKQEIKPEFNVRFDEFHQFVSKFGEVNAASNKKRLRLKRKKESDIQDQPVQKKQKVGTNSKLVILQTMQCGIKYRDMKVGDGKVVSQGDKLRVFYVGQTEDKQVFDKCISDPAYEFNFGKGDVIKGWEMGLKGMRVGGKRKLVIPPQLAYGASGSPPTVPPNATLTFTIEVKSCVDRSRNQQRL